MDVTPITLGVRELRLARGMTQSQLAESADVRKATISEMESGKTSSINLAVLDRVAMALGVPAAMLIQQTAHRTLPLPPVKKTRKPRG